MNAINKQNEVSMFKVMDLITYNNNHNHKDGRIFQVMAVYEADLYAICGDDHMHMIFMEVRHATEQEIAAGHRIDLEDLHDCDTSPNCKKYER